MTANNVHLIEDESIGGLLREYVETDRKADVGDYVYITDFEGEEVEHIAEVTDVDMVANQFDFKPKIDGGHIFDYGFEECKTLDPTDIVRVDNQRYKLADRQAEVGEKVVIVNAEESHGKYKNGDVLEAQRCHYDMGIENDLAKAKYNSDGYIRNAEYRVLEPVESEQAEITSDGGVKYSSGRDDVGVTVDESQASPDVIDMLTNLSRRIVRLEDEINTLHSNQKRMAEELANLSAATNSEQDSAEVIVELAKLLVEKVREGGR